jgi:hypothetical protein
MKLYTEEQVRKMLEVCLDSDLYEHILTFEDILKTETTIEIPTDEDISELKNEMEYDEFDAYDIAYFAGMYYLRDKIQGGNNDQQ